MGVVKYRNSQSLSQYLYKSTSQTMDGHCCAHKLLTNSINHLISSTGAHHGGLLTFFQIPPDCTLAEEVSITLNNPLFLTDNSFATDTKLFSFNLQSPITSNITLFLSWSTHHIWSTTSDPYHPSKICSCSVARLIGYEDTSPSYPTHPQTISNILWAQSLYILPSSSFVAPIPYLSVTNFIWQYLYQFFDDLHSLNVYGKPSKRPFNWCQSCLEAINIGQDIRQIN